MFARKNRFIFRIPLPEKVFRSSLFTLNYGNTHENIQIAVVVSKKVDKRSTVRNILKRRVLRILRQNLKDKDKLALVLHMKKEALESGDILEKEIKRAILTVHSI